MQVNLFSLFIRHGNVWTAEEKLRNRWKKFSFVESAAMMPGSVTLLCPPKLHMSQDLRWGFPFSIVIGSLRLFCIEISLLSLIANLLYFGSSLRRGF
jgi:hypothetical protein